MLATVLVDQGRFAEALVESDAALAADPYAIQALMQRGFALQAMNRPIEALAHYDGMLALNPRFPPALYFRGRILFELGRAAEALASFDRALALDEKNPDLWLARATVLQQLHRSQEAMASYDRALALRPDFPEVWLGRAATLEDMGLAQDALASYDRAIALRPNYDKAHNNRGVTLMGLRRFREAAAAYEKTLASPTPAPFAFGGLAAALLYACDWEKAEALQPAVEEHVAQGKSLVSPGVFLGYSDDPALQHRCAGFFTQQAMSPLPEPLWKGETFQNSKIRIAYLSADFHEHATAHLIAELFERHDRTRFELWGMGFDADDGSAIRRRLVKSFDRFEDVAGKSDLQAAQLLHQNRIDIAIDLKGHTLQARPRIFAHRPAPIQVNYLGYPGSMGSEFYDYILGDSIVTPLDQRPFYSESIVQLPDCYQPNDATRVLTAPVPGRAQAGLPEKGFVFCCFNNNWKITRPVFEVWMRLLEKVPGSVLWLLQDSDEAANNLRRHAVAAGIAPERLIFAPRLDVDLHLARHQLADLFLDTLPYNAHTTASDSLRVGVPLVTCMGQSFPARVAASLLHAVGLPELVTENLADYETPALALARDPARLAALRQKLAANRPITPLFDSARYAKGIEAAYSRMWDIWQSGEKPSAFAVSL